MVLTEQPVMIKSKNIQSAHIEVEESEENS